MPPIGQRQQPPHAPNAGPRKSWAADDATARGVRLADIALRDEADCHMPWT